MKVVVYKQVFKKWSVISWPGFSQLQIGANDEQYSGREILNIRTTVSLFCSILLLGVHCARCCIKIKQWRAEDSR